MYLCSKLINMVLDSRIKALPRDSFRSGIYLEDIRSNIGEVVHVYSSDEKYLTPSGDALSEEAIVFKGNPIVVPNMKYMWATKIGSVRNYFLRRAVCDLMFINPNIGGEGVDKMADYLLHVMVRYSLNKSTDKKEFAISREEIRDAVHLIYESNPEIEIVETNKVIVYKKYSLLRPSDKLYYTNKYRYERIHEITEELIHEGAILASENMHKLMKITNPRIQEHTTKEMSLSKIGRHISDRTLRFMEDENVFRHFKTQKSIDKFEEFLDMYCDDVPMSKYVSELNISYSTVIKYIDICK